jgi:hypothetical protein
MTAKSKSEVSSPVAAASLEPLQAHRVMSVSARPNLGPTPRSESFAARDGGSPGPALPRGFPFSRLSWLARRLQSPQEMLRSALALPRA